MNRGPFSFLFLIKFSLEGEFQFCHRHRSWKRGVRRLPLKAFGGRRSRRGGIMVPCWDADEIMVALRSLKFSVSP
jgi:hypothetical protein